MFGKKGFIKTVEAVFAIVILLGLVLYIFSNNPKPFATTPYAVENANNFIINEFLNDNTFRSCFIKSSEGDCNSALNTIKTSDNKECKEVINEFLLKSTPQGYSYWCEVCKSSRSCSNLVTPKEKSVYPRSGFLYSPEMKEGRIIRVYLY